MLTSRVCTMPRQLPGVTCRTFVTRWGLPLCMMTMPTLSWVAAITGDSFGGKGERPTSVPEVPVRAQIGGSVDVRNRDRPEQAQAADRALPVRRPPDSASLLDAAVELRRERGGHARIGLLQVSLRRGLDGGLPCEGRPDLGLDPHQARAGERGRV